MINLKTHFNNWSRGGLIALLSSAYFEAPIKPRLIPLLIVFHDQKHATWKNLTHHNHAFPGAYLVIQQYED